MNLSVTAKASKATTARKRPEPSAKIEIIGPSEARYLLRLNTHNRHIRGDRVATMARDMAAGKWVMNGETVKVSETDRLLDGQHRLLAVVESKAQVPMMVIRGLKDESQETVDMGTKRQLSDVLTLAGDASAHNLGAAVRFAWYIDNFNRPKQFGVNPSISELQTWLEKNSNIRASITVGARAGRSVIRYTPSVATALHYLMGRTGRHNEFWDHLIDGDVGPGDPIYALREALLRDLASPHRMSIQHRAALTIKSYNALLEGRQMTQIGWRKDGRGAEAYPVLGNKEVK